MQVVAADDEVTSALLLAPAQQRAVDAAFQELFGYKWGTRFQLPRRRRPSGRRKTTTTNGDDDGAAVDQQQQLLVQILGPVRAARMLQTGGTMRPVRRRQPQSSLAKWTKSAAATTTDSTPAVSITQQQQPRYETKLFAGQKIQVAVAASAPAPTAATTNNKTAAAGAGNIDSVLQQIAGPSKISTVAKTSADWDSFKTETGLESELEQKAQGKDAFLVKQDFLTRVDNRKFALERDDRDKERAKRGK